MKFSTSAVIVSLLSITTSSPVPAPPAGGLTKLIPKTLPTFTRAQCNTAGAQMPAANPPLAAPLANTHLALVAVGHGTQNYTCADSSASTVPVAAGAVANLYNATCIAASQPSMLARITAASKNVPDSRLKVMPAIGKHFFADSTTPVFDVKTIGVTHLKKIAASPAAGAANGDVPWLFLETKADGTTSKVTAIYRLNTAGGAAPATCEGITGHVEVKYAAEYWFYST